MPTEVLCARCEGPTPIGIGTKCPKCGSMEKYTVSTLAVPEPAPRIRVRKPLPLGEALEEDRRMYTAIPQGSLIRTRTKGRSRGTAYPLRGSLPTMTSNERLNPIEANYRRAREMTSNMPPQILGVFAPDEMKELDDLRAEFVNTYRHAWGSNAGLSTEKINNMSRRELEESIRSLKRLIEANEKSGYYGTHP